MNIYQKMARSLESLGLAHLNGRPYDCAHTVLENKADQRKLVVVGFNGSDADLEWTNLSAIQHGESNPDWCNVSHGAKGGWLSSTLPRRLLALPESLGFDTKSTVFTNALLLCSENAHAVKKKAKKFGFSHVNQLIDTSLRFFEEITIQETMPELIIAYSNSLNDLSAAKVLLDRFGVSPISIVNDSSYYNTFSFMAEICGKRIPVVCIRHMSRFKPCFDSITQAWRAQVDLSV